MNRTTPAATASTDYMMWMWEAPTDGQYIRRQSGPAAALWDEMDAFGAILAGRRTVEQVDHWGGDRHGVRIFVPSRRPPGPSVANYPLVTYVSDGIESAMAQAKAAAGDRFVMVHGAYTAQRALEAGVLDEVQIHAFEDQAARKPHCLAAQFVRSGLADRLAANPLER
jgi:dihydrofolate reductase